MKKNYFIILLIIFASCDKNDNSLPKSQSTSNPKQVYIINGDIEYEAEVSDISDYSPLPKFIYDNLNDIIKETAKEKTTNKTAENSVTLTFDYGIAGSTKSGCTMSVLDPHSLQRYTTDNGVYGPFPYAQEQGHLVRGFGLPHHNLSYNSLIFFARNKSKETANERGEIKTTNDKEGAAISIEYPFKANVTYEITLKAVFRDNKYLVEKKRSTGYPTVYVELKDDGIIKPSSARYQNQDPCKQKDLNEVGTYPYDNYSRSHTLEDTPRDYFGKDLTFKFSPTEQKNALLISFHPAIGAERIGIPIPENNYTIILPRIIITEKPFDPTINVEVPPRGPRPRG